MPRPSTQNGSKTRLKSSNDYGLKTTLYKDYVNKKRLKDSPELSSALDTKDFSQMAAKHQMIEDITEKLLGIVPSTHQSSDSVDKYVKFNVYAPRYCQEDLISSSRECIRTADDYRTLNGLSWAYVYQSQN